jgi:hypothetical protein
MLERGRSQRRERSSQEAVMMRRISLVFAVLPFVFGCSEDEEESSTDGATMSASNGSGGMLGSGGMMGADSGGNGGSTTGDATTGNATTGDVDSICETGCEATLEADCENGPDTMEQCVCDC